MWFHGFLIAFGVASFADTSTTMYGIGKGNVREANPIYRQCVEVGPITAGICKGTGTVLVVEGMYQLNKTHPKWALAAAIGGTVGQIFLAAHNAKEIKK